MLEDLSIWKLRTHPFRRPTDADGNPLPDNVLFSSLNPLEDKRLVRFYFDIYNWDRSKLVNGLDRTKLLDRFPDATSLKESKGILILISGEDAAGRESLQNLILHKIELENAGKKPLLINVNLDGLKQTANVKLIARRFCRVYKREEFLEPDADDLKDLYTSETKEAS